MRRRTPTRGWGALYLAGMLGFAGLYTGFASGFRASPAFQEVALSHEMDEAENDLTRSIREAFRYYAIGQVFLKDGTWLARIDSLKAAALSLENGTPDFIVQATFIDVGPRKQPAQHPILHVRFAATHYEYMTELTVDGRTAGPPRVSIPVEVDNCFGFAGSPTLSGKLVFPAVMPGNIVLPKGAAGRIAWLSLDRRAYKRFTRLQVAALGNAGSLPRSPLRMLYLSCVVQTTLGFGDIVPVTGLARFLVGSQVVFGVVVAGLFLNGAARLARGSNSHEPEIRRLAATSGAGDGAQEIAAPVSTSHRPSSRPQSQRGGDPRRRRKRRRGR